MPNENERKQMKIDIKKNPAGIKNTIASPGMFN